jgi:proteic killer suppression protein
MRPTGAQGSPPSVSNQLTQRKQSAYIAAVIKTFRSKALADLWQTGRSGKIDARMHKRILIRLDRLDAAGRAEDLNLPGFDFHPLHGTPVRYSVHVNGPWCLTFEFDGDACRVDFQQYH